MHFCTYFDVNFLIKGLALYDSLKNNCEQFTLWILCLDELSSEIILKLNYKNINCIKLIDIENTYNELLSLKKSRSKIEYYFTLTPILPLYILEKNKDINLLTYLDADLYFFSSLKPVFDEFSDKSILIIEHRFPLNSPKNLYDCGIFNVGFLSFKRDEEGIKCLKDWKENCIEWCYDRVEEGKYADQKYLDSWPIKYKNVCVLKHKGANLAPWNINSFDIIFKNGKVYADNDELIFYHFHGLKEIGNFFVDSRLITYNVKKIELIKKHIYSIYLKKISTIQTNLKVIVKNNSLKKFNSIRNEIKNQKVSIVKIVYRKIRLINYIFNGLINNSVWFKLNQKYKNNDIE